MTDRVERRVGGAAGPELHTGNVQTSPQATMPSAERDLCVELGVDDLCGRCGVNLAASGQLCTLCMVDDDFESCEFCHGEDCTGECETELW